VVVRLFWIGVVSQLWDHPLEKVGGRTLPDELGYLGYYAFERSSKIDQI